MNIQFGTEPVYFMSKKSFYVDLGYLGYSIIY